MTGQEKPVTARDITELLAWARRLSNAGPSTHPQEKAAYLAAKADLLTRIHATKPQEKP